MKKTVNVIIFALLLLIFGSYMFTFQVRQDQIAFVDTFGDISKPIEDAGLHYRLPWPIQRVYTFDKRIHLKTTDYSQITTGDGSLIVQAYFGWRISSPKTFMEKAKGATDVERMQHAERNLEREIEGAVSTVFGGEKNLTEKQEVSLGTLIDGESGKADDENRHTFERLEQKIFEQVEPMSKQYGMELSFVGIRRVGISQQSLITVLDAMVTQWTNAALTDAFIAEEQARSIRDMAINNKASELDRARAQANQIISSASAKEAEIFAQMEKKDARLAELLLKLSTMEKVLKKEATLLLDENVPFLEPMRPQFFDPSPKSGEQEDSGSESEPENN